MYQLLYKTFYNHLLLSTEVIIRLDKPTLVRISKLNKQSSTNDKPLFEVDFLIKYTCSSMTTGFVHHLHIKVDYCMS